MTDQDYFRQLNEGKAFYKVSDWSKRWHIDFMLIGCLMILCGGGLFILYSASGQDISIVIRQAVYMLIGFFSIIIIAQFSPRMFMRLSSWIYVGGIILLVAVLVMGIYSKGAQRWIQLPFIRFQPSEIIKLIMPIMIATYLSKRRLPPSLKDILIVLTIICIPVVLIAKQPDLGTSLLVGASGIFVLFLAGLQKKLIFSAIMLALPTMWCFWDCVMLPYQKQRVLTFLNPESDFLGAGWNIIQSKIAIGSGGIYGKGWLLGTQSYLDFLPESHTDFIIAVLAEEFGLMGCLLLLVLYALIIGRGFFIAMKTPTSFGALLAGSITLTFFFYIFVNIGMVGGLLPVVGVPLPLISRGGTSLATLMAGFGILISIHTHRTLLSHSR